jgi:hypothetical protein
LDFYFRPKATTTGRPTKGSAKFACILILAVSSEVRAQDVTWLPAPADALWSNPINWSAAPASGDVLHFSASSITTLTNDLAAGTSISGLLFDEEASPFLLTGNSLTLTGQLVNNGTSSQVVNLPLQFAPGSAIHTSLSPIAPKLPLRPT